MELMLLISSIVIGGSLSYMFSETRNISTGKALAWGCCLGLLGALIVYMYDWEDKS